MVSVGIKLPGALLSGAEKLVKHKGFEGARGKKFAI